LESFLNRSSPGRAESSFSIEENRDEDGEKAVAKPKGQEGTRATAAVGKPGFGSGASQRRGNRRGQQCADGSRVAAVIPPCSLLGVKLTIRKLNTRYFGMQDLFEAGTLDQSLANRLEDYVLSRKSIAAFSTKLLEKMENEAAA